MAHGWGRDFAAWLGLVPKQHSTGGKPRLGQTPKMGQRDIRRLLVSGAMAVLQAVERFDTPNNGWLKCLLPRKPRMVVASALANQMARALWAMLTKQVEAARITVHLARLRDGLGSAAEW
jgi:transposase